jgi:hypothetical protein
MRNRTNSLFQLGTPDKLSDYLCKLAVFRYLNNTATESTKANKGKIANIGNSGTVGVDVEVKAVENELLFIVIVCELLQSLFEPLKLKGSPKKIGF